MGSYDDVNRLCAELTSEHPTWGFANVNLRTYYAEGSKTLAFEMVEQLGWQAPDHVIVPVGSGSQLTKVAKGFEELGALGLLDEAPEVRVSGAQPEGCSPVATAFAEGTDAIRPVRPSTIAKSLAIGNPADGWYALETVRRTGGALAAVGDTEIIDAIRLLARTEGIFAETAGGVTIATLSKLGGARRRPPRRAGRRDRERPRAQDGRGAGRGGAAHRHDRSEPGVLRSPGGGFGPRRPSRQEDEMSVKVRIPTQLRNVTGGKGELEAEGSTVGEVLQKLDAEHPGLGERLFDEAGSLRRFVNVFLDDEDVRFLQGLDTPVPDGQTISVVPAVAGG